MIPMGLRQGNSRVIVLEHGGRVFTMEHANLAQ